MSRTAITSKFKMCWFPNEGCYWAGKLSTGINLEPLKPDEDKTFSGSLVLDLRISWRHLHTLCLKTPASRFSVKENHNFWKWSFSKMLETRESLSEFSLKHKSKTTRDCYKWDGDVQGNCVTNNHGQGVDTFEQNKRFLSASFRNFKMHLFFNSQPSPLPLFNFAIRSVDTFTWWQHTKGERGSKCQNSLV